MARHARTAPALRQGARTTALDRILACIAERVHASSYLQFERETGIGRTMVKSLVERYHPGYHEPVIGQAITPHRVPGPETLGLLLAWDEVQEAPVFGPLITDYLLELGRRIRAERVPMTLTAKEARAA